MNFSVRMRALLCASILLVGFVSGGATCSPRPTVFSYPPPPSILAGTPALTDVVAAVNRTAAVRELSSNTASIKVLSMPKIPDLPATLHLRRDREFRLRGSMPMVMGTALDMGSNPNLFWFQVPEGLSKTLYYARHDLYQQRLDRAIFPVDPTWVMDTLGLVQIDQTKVIAGPELRADGKLEIRSVIDLPAGRFQRVCLIDASAGHVTDQFLYSPAGDLIAQSNASNHEYFVQQQCSLPHTVQLALSPKIGDRIELQIDVGTYAVNQILSGDPNLFVMPTSAANSVDLTTLTTTTVPVVAPTNYRTTEVGPIPYRGIVAPPGQ